MDSSLIFLVRYFLFYTLWVLLCLFVIFFLKCSTIVIFINKKQIFQ